MSLSPPATTGITTAMTTALTTAQTALQTLSTTGQLDNLSLAQLQNAIIAVETAYNTYAAGLTPPTGINLDAITGASTLEGINSFVTEVGDVVNESDIQLALFYIARIISNLMLAGG